MIFVIGQICLFVCTLVFELTAPGLTNQFYWKIESLLAVVDEMRQLDPS